ncbi:hypothetical protein [Aquipseudomonas alcaligenes]|nr:hypothetical protein [Pseudomonas alcaligenes]
MHSKPIPQSLLADIGQTPARNPLAGRAKGWLPQRTATAPPQL